MMKRYLGQLGERTLGTWASQVGIAANKADPDRTGWDFILEFPDPASQTGITLPLDKLPWPIQCLVQVKSTDGRSSKCSVKLSNWVRLVNTPLPAFFLALEFDSKDDCQRAYLVHIDETYIRRVLKRLRKLGASASAELHKTTIQFKWNEAYRLPSLNGKGLEKAIRSHVGDLETYVEWKTETLRTAGYEDGKWKLDFVIPAPPDCADIQELLVDFSLGLIPHIDVIQGAVRDCRFGIPAPEPTETFEGGRVELGNREAAGSGVILLTAPDGNRELRLSTDVYVPQGIDFEELEREYFKVRFTAPFIDFFFWPFSAHRLDFRYELPKVTEEHKLGHLQPVSDFILLLQDAHAGGGRIEFEAMFDSRSLCKGHIDVHGALGKRVVDYATTIVHAWTIAKHFDIHDVVDLRPIEVLRQQERLRFMASVVGPTQPSAMIVYWSRESMPDDGKPMCLPYVTDAVIGQYRVAVAAAIIGQPVKTGRTRQEEENEFQEFQMETREVRLCRQHLYARDEAPRHTFKELVQSVLEEYEEVTDILIAEGINEHLIDSQD